MSDIIKYHGRMLALADLENYSEAEVKAHLVDNFTPSVMSYANDEEVNEYRALLDEHDVLIAYESVGSWGCDSSAFFLLQNRASEKYYSIYGSHCSCHGFEGQGELEETELAYLQSDQFWLSTGGYDDDDEKNSEAVLAYVKTLRAPSWLDGELSGPSLPSA